MRTLGIVLAALCLANRSVAAESDAVDLYRCSFGPECDADFDGWPDGWFRTIDERRPHYVPLRLAGDAPEVPVSVLRADLNGGAVLAGSPQVDVQPGVTLSAKCLIRAVGLRRDAAWLELTLWDAQGGAIQRFRSAIVSGDAAGQTLEIGPTSPAPPEAAKASLQLVIDHAVSRRELRHDLRGVVAVDDVQLAVVPRLQLQIAPPQALIPLSETIEFRCLLTASAAVARQAQMAIRDANDNVLFEQELTFEVEATDSAPGHSASLAARQQWSAPAAGYYEVQLVWQSASGQRYEQRRGLAVIDPQLVLAEHASAWTLTPAQVLAPADLLCRTLAECEVKRVKLPLWSLSGDSGQLRGLSELVDRLSRQGVEIVGVLDSPPEQRLESGVLRDLLIAEAFALQGDRAYDTIEPLLARVGVRVRSWQLGVDGDASFADHVAAAEKLQEIQARIEQIARGARLIVGWDENGVPHAPASCDVLNLPLAQTPADDFVAPSQPPEVQRPRWFALTPDRLPDEPSEQVRQFVMQMLHVHARGAESVSLFPALDDQRGLMRADGAPGRLLLPWRTCAGLLAKSEPLGSLELTGGSPNLVFSRGGEAVVAVWGAADGSERFCSGGALTQCDVWGRTAPLPQDDQGFTEFPVAQLPTFLLGLPEPLARWHVATRLEAAAVPTIFGQPQINAVLFRNDFPTAISGRCRIHADDTWRVEPREFEFRLLPGESGRQQISILLPFDALTGPQPVRLEFDLFGQANYHLELDRRIRVGLDDLQLEASSRLSETGELVVVQRLVNKTGRPVRLRSQLFVPGRRRLRVDVQLPDEQPVVSAFYLRDGRSLLGQTIWIKAEEADGQRILNFRFEATP